MRSPEEFQRIRESNRREMGLAGWEPPVVRTRVIPLGTAGLGDGILGAALGVVGPVRFTSSFPPADVHYDPRQLVAPSSGSGLSDWVLRHLTRPTFEVAGVRVAPYESYADYSQIATVGTIVAGLGVLGTIAWALYRAFSGGKRANPRRARGGYYVSGRSSRRAA